MQNYCSPFIIEDTSAALRATKELVKALKKAKNPFPSEHLELFKSVDKVRAALEQPFDVVTRLLESSCTSGAMLSIVETGILQKISIKGSITADELAAAARMDVSAVVRLMRVAVVSGIFTETAPDTYTHNALSQSFSIDWLGGMFLITQGFSKTFHSLPDYFKSHAPEELHDLKKTPFAYAFSKEGLTYYDIINQDAEKRDVWDKALANMDKNMPVTGMFTFVSLRDQVERSQSGRSSSTSEADVARRC